MANLTKLSARLAGVGSVALGGLVLVRPVQFGKLLGVDTSKQAGKVLTYGLAVRDIAIGIYILRAKDTKGLRRAITVRMLGEISDTLMTAFGRGVIRQPAGRKLALGIPPLIAVEYFLIRKLKD